MHKYLKVFENTQINKVQEIRKEKKIDAFNVGDTIKITYKVVDENSQDSRTQSMTGVVLGKKKPNSSAYSFTVKKILDQENSYIKHFMFYSPMIESIERIKSGRVRRAKLYYLNSLYGKAARIKEKK